MNNRFLASLASRFGRVPARETGAATTMPSLGNVNLFSKLTFVDHLLILRALILRDLRVRHQESRFGFMVEFIQPIFVIGVHYVGFNIMNRYMPGHIPVELFVTGGFTTWFALSYAARGKHGRPNRLQSISPGITPMHSVIAGTLWECLANITLCYTILIIFLMLGFDDPLPNIPLSIAVFFIAAANGYGLRLIFDAIGEVFSMVHTVKGTVMWVNFFTGGIYFSASRITGPFGDAVLYNPTLHLLEFQRRALCPGYPIAVVSMVYPIVFGIVLIMIGLILNRWVKRSVA